MNIMDEDKQDLPSFLDHMKEEYPKLCQCGKPIHYGVDLCTDCMKSLIEKLSLFLDSLTDKEINWLIERDLVDCMGVYDCQIEDDDESGCIWYV